MAKIKVAILLLIDREGQERRIEEFNENIIKIGKLSSVTLRLDDPNINRIHAVIEATGENEAQIIDMGSSKGTRVNGKRVHKAKVASGDQLLLGDTTISIFIGEQAIQEAKASNFGQNPDISEDPLSGTMLETINSAQSEIPAESTQVSRAPIAPITNVADAAYSNPEAAALVHSEANAVQAYSAQSDLDSLLASVAGLEPEEATVVGVISKPSDILLPAQMGEEPEEPATAIVSAKPEEVIAQIIGQAAPVVQPAPSASMAQVAAQVSAQGMVEATARVQAPEVLAPQQAQPAIQTQVPEQQAPQQPQMTAQLQAPQQPQMMAPLQAPQQPQMTAQLQAPQQPQMTAQLQAPQQPQVTAQLQAPQQPQMQNFQAPQQPQMQNFQAPQMQFQNPSTGYIQQPVQTANAFPNVAQANPVMSGQFQAPAANNFSATGGFPQSSPNIPQPGMAQSSSFAQQSQQPAPVAAPLQASIAYQDAGPEETQEALEVRVMWGSTILDHAHFYNPKRITVGESRKNDFSISGDLLPPELSSFPLIEAQDGRILINFTDSMDGQVQIEENHFTLAQIKQSSKVQQTSFGYQFALPAKSKVEIKIGETSFAISFVPAPKRIPVALSQIDHHLARAMGASFLIHGMMLLFMLFSDENPKTLDEGLLMQNDRFTRLIVHPPEEKKKEKPKKRVKKGGGAKAKGKKGKMGRKNKKVVKNRRSAQKKKNKDGRGPIDLKKAQKELLNDKDFKELGLLGKSGGQRNTNKLLNLKGRGGDSINALGGLLGSVAGKSGGGGGLGMGGKGLGGGGRSGGSVGVGRLGTYGRGGGKGGKKWGRGRLRRKKKQRIKVTTGPPKIFGALDKAIIRRLINQNRSRIKYCYERELAKYPNLAGKIFVFFQIEGNGRVSTSTIKQTTMNNYRVEGCIKRRIKFIRFPAPKGGGIVHVNYPFYFKPS